ncbi:hypothetical protein L596_000848 [Steinernema carpocapsae]|uniref:Uncharacterized protein n=1 Tax=Steinernema carpocapsae TaxID=34508 RepID=A0A4U8UK31_STECR|nr:hypothetical protein L596_000848 [Steinernema carpocapsae]
MARNVGIREKGEFYQLLSVPDATALYNRGRLQWNRPKTALNGGQFGVCDTDFGAVAVAKPTAPRQPQQTDRAKSVTIKENDSDDRFIM